MEKIVWNTSENYDATRVSKQHAFKSSPCQERAMGIPIGERYEGNISLCGKLSIINESESKVHLNEIDSEPLNIDKCCKKCKKILEKL